VSVAVQAMKAGAVDFLEKPFEKAALLQAVTRAFARIDDADIHAIEASDAQVRIAGLTPREREVLEGLAQGHPNKTIAYDLGCSSRTVEVHRASLMTKLDVRNLSEALRIAFAAGMGRKPK
jgi:two-component system response regulator FixJ